ncbi:hypothetical protein B0H13DRAFT_2660306 [Mycena leptocephala]|nr:hypothetical protein B0H13DRAFT_2660306 [Mycena leptocephala]
MPAAPKSPQSKKPGAPKAKGAVRAKSGCYTCRIRRKKCDEHQSQDGHCETRVRLRLQCLGFGAKRPEWLRESRNVSEMRDKIKGFLAAQGMIKSHSGSGLCGSEHDLPIRKLDEDELKEPERKELEQPERERKRQERNRPERPELVSQREKWEREYEEEQERQLLVRILRRILRWIQLIQLLEADSLVLKLLSSFIFTMLAILALELVGWFIFLGLLITILAYLLIIISFVSAANIKAPGCTQEILHSAVRLFGSTLSVGAVLVTHLLHSDSPARVMNLAGHINTARGADRKLALRSHVHRWCIDSSMNGPCALAFDRL